MSITSYISSFAASPLAHWKDLEPWALAHRASHFIYQLIESISKDEFIISDGIAIHASASIEPGAILKKPAIIGPKCLIAAGAYIREGCWLEDSCFLGPGTEVKSSFIFKGSRLAHFNYVGNSIIGQDVNLEAGSIIANHYNERVDKEIYVIRNGQKVHTGVTKFGALVGDGCRIGANAVIAPGSLMLPKQIVGRLALFEQS